MKGLTRLQLRGVQAIYQSMVVIAVLLAIVLLCPVYYSAKWRGVPQRERELPCGWEYWVNDLIVDYTPLGSVVLKWSAVWGVRDSFESASIDRKITREVAKLPDGDGISSQDVRRILRKVRPRRASVTLEPNRREGAIVTNSNKELRSHF